MKRFPHILLTVAAFFALAGAVTAQDKTSMHSMEMHSPMSTAMPDGMHHANDGHPSTDKHHMKAMHSEDAMDGKQVTEHAQHAKESKHMRHAQKDAHRQHTMGAVQE